MLRSWSIYVSILALFFTANILLWKRISEDPISKSSKFYISDEQSASEIDLIIFTTFEQTERRKVVHTNTKLNWKSLGINVKPVLFTNDSVVAEEFLQEKWDILPVKHVSFSGTPVLKSMFTEVKAYYKAPFIGYANSDILFTDTLLTTLQKIASNFGNKRSHVMLSGRRTDIFNLTKDRLTLLDYLLNKATGKGQAAGDTEDYFITDWDYPWETVPDVVVGRPAYDNFLLLFSRMNGYVTVDASSTLLAVHQVVDKGYLKEKWNSTRYEEMYNVYVVLGIYRNVNFLAGRTDCLTYQTWLDGMNFIILKRKRLPKYCEFFTDLIANQKKYIDKFYSKQKKSVIKT